MSHNSSPETDSLEELQFLNLSSLTVLRSRVLAAQQTLEKKWGNFVPVETKTRLFGISRRTFVLRPDDYDQSVYHKCVPVDETDPLPVFAEGGSHYYGSRLVDLLGLSQVGAIDGSDEKIVNQYRQVIKRHGDPVHALYFSAQGEPSQRAAILAEYTPTAIEKIAPGLGAEERQAITNHEGFKSFGFALRNQGIIVLRYCDDAESFADQQQIEEWADVFDGDQKKMRNALACAIVDATMLRSLASLYCNVGV